MTRRLGLIGRTLPLMWGTWQYCSVLPRDLAFLGRLLSSRASSNCLTQNHTEGVILTKAAGREIYSLVLMSKCSEKNLTFTRSENEAVCTSQGDLRCAQRAQHGRRQGSTDVQSWGAAAGRTFLTEMVALLLSRQTKASLREKRSPLGRAR